MVSEPTLRASWVRHVESDSPPSGNRPRVTISGTRYKAAANGTAPQKPELHGTIEEAADGEAEEILYPISFQQRCERTSSGCLLEIETDVPIHARMRAALSGLDQGEFTEGHELDRKWGVPKAMIGRRLSQGEAKRLLAKLRGPFLFTQPTTPTSSIPPGNWDGTLVGNQ